MQTAHSTLAMSDQALPPEVSLQSDTWLYRYRHYPVFSRTWFRYRSYAFVGCQSIAVLLITLIFWLAEKDMTRFLVFVMPFFLGSTVLCLLGQSMAVRVRQRMLAARTEAVFLTAVLCLGAALSWGIFEGLHYGAKYLAYGDGNITLHFSEKKHTSEQRRTKETLGASAAASVTTEVVREDIPNPNLGKFSPSVEMILSMLQMLPFAFMLFYCGSGFDLWFFFRQRKKLIEALRQQELQRAKTAQREAELRLSVLVAQVEPHFLFNTLAGVRSAIQTEPLRATAIVDHLVDYLRATIPQMRDDGASVQGRLAQQLEAARAYLGLMQARIPRLSFEVSSEVADAALPPLMLISLVENAVKHGVEPKIGPVHIRLSARRLDSDKESMLELTVSDNGVGFGGTTSGSGIGLQNIRERLAAMYGGRASLCLKAQQEGGVAAIIVLPLLD